MDAWTREQRRREVAGQRIAPRQPQRLFFAAAGLGQPTPLRPQYPVELLLESTLPDGQMAGWLTDEWWIGMQAYCRGRSVTVLILPTPKAALNHVLLHQLDMLRRIAPEWRLIGYAQLEEARYHPEADRWLMTPYEEIRFCGPTGSAVGSVAEQLVDEAARRPRSPGLHRASLRLTPVMPKRPGELPPPLPPTALVVPPRNRLLESVIVEST